MKARLDGRAFLCLDARIPPILTPASKLAGDPDRKVRDGWGTRNPTHRKERDGWGTRNPTHRKERDGWGTRNPTHRKERDGWGTRNPTHRKERDGWGTQIPPIAKSAMDGAPEIPPIAKSAMDGAPEIPPIAKSAMDGAPEIPPIAKSAMDGAPGRGLSGRRFGGELPKFDAGGGGVDRGVEGPGGEALVDGVDEDGVGGGAIADPVLRALGAGQSSKAGGGALR